MVIVATIFFVLTITADRGAKILFPVTKSVPHTAYLVTNGAPQNGDFVHVRITQAALEQTRAIIAKRSPLARAPIALNPSFDLPETWIKQLAASGGDNVCILGSGLYINGFFRAASYRYSSTGDRLPDAKICRDLKETEIFVIGTHQHSFDSRNFGPLPRENLISKLKPLNQFWETED
jgi:type IV secretory pathway protease TraF